MKLFKWLKRKRKDILKNQLYYYPLLLVTNDPEAETMKVGDFKKIYEQFNVNLLDVHNDIGKLDMVAVENSTKQMIQLSRCDQFQGKSFFLNSSYDWVLGRTNSGRIVLIPFNPTYPGKDIFKQLRKNR